MSNNSERGHRSQQQTSQAHGGGGRRRAAAGAAGPGSADYTLLMDLYIDEVIMKPEFLYPFGTTQDEKLAIDNLFMYLSTDSGLTVYHMFE